ncbi:MAG: ribosomal RNA small subunit methyltransferase A [Phycisphaeraceae bacterium]|nr:ribosomal RNA small subunit methyltransferase A [Phycisphaeraceae bacterium]
MQTLSEIRSLLRSRGLRPKHRYGQNFLHDHHVLAALVESAGIEPPAPGAAAPLVLEVGPGTGTLTEVLLERGARVVACEIDRDMLAIIGERVLPRADGRLTLVEGDCLKGKRRLAPAVVDALATAARADAPAANSPRFALVANLPYGAATPLIATLLANHPECTGLFATIQREVADRLMATPRSDAYGALSVTTQLLARVERVMDVAPGCFWPEPEVTSAIVAIDPRRGEQRPASIGTPAEAEAFASFVTGVFSKRRKQIGTILGRGAQLPPGVEATQRPEELAPETWLALWPLQAPPAAAATDPVKRTERRATGRSKGPAPNA